MTRSIVGIAVVLSWLATVGLASAANPLTEPRPVNRHPEPATGVVTVPEAKAFIKRPQYRNALQFCLRETPRSLRCHARVIFGWLLVIHEREDGVTTEERLPFWVTLWVKVGVRGANWRATDLIHPSQI